MTCENKPNEYTTIMQNNGGCISQGGGSGGGSGWGSK
jgi:hypothetical protein